MSVDNDVERRLRAGLHAWQDEIAPATADFPARLRERRRRRQRARRSVAVALVAAAAVVITAGVVARDIVTSEAPPAAPPGEGSGRTLLPDLVDVPTRGSLADDAAWVGGVRDLPWPAPEGLPTGDFVPQAEDRRVAFAGDVPGGRVALVLGEIGNRTLRMWFTGPADAAPHDLRPAVEADDVLPNYPLALWELVEDGADDGVLVVVAFPGDSAVFAPGLRPRDPIDDGVTEPFQPVELVDGVGSTSAPRPTGLPLSTAVGVVHPVGGSTDVFFDVGDRAAAALRLPELEDPRGLRAAVPDRWIDSAVDQLVLLEGIEAEGLTVTLLQAGGVRDTANRSSVLVVGTARDGDTATVLEVYETMHPVWATDAERGSGSWGARGAVTPTRRDAPPPLQRVLAVPMDEFLALSAPVETGTVEVLDASGEVLAMLSLQRGGVSSVVPDGAVGVRVLDAAGDLVAEQPLTEVLEGSVFLRQSAPRPAVSVVPPP